AALDAAAVGFALLIWWFAGDARLGGVVAGGFLGAFALFALVAWLCILGLARLRGAAGAGRLRPPDDAGAARGIRGGAAPLPGA
ncbi:hypothetical protein SB758_33040, partial [Burkholderia sp. SIMBA_013]